jgi:hypothetical protein
MGELEMEFDGSEEEDGTYSKCSSRSIAHCFGLDEFEGKVPFRERKHLHQCDTTLKMDASISFIYEYILKLGIFYDKGLGIVICPVDGCQTLIRHDHVWSHCWNKGHWSGGFFPRPPTRPVLVHWLEKAGLDKDPQELLGKSTHLPHGVQVIEKAYKCTLPICHAKSRIFPNAKKFHAHHKNSANHPGSVLKAEDRPFDHVQAFPLSLSHQDRHLVEVSNSTNLSEDPRVEQLVLATELEDEKRKTTGMFKGLEDDRQAKTWVYFLGWHTELENNSIPQLQGLIALPPDGLPESRLLPIVRAYIEAGNKLINGVPQDIRSDLGNTGRLVI